jgi:hypothetical protein
MSELKKILDDYKIRIFKNYNDLNYFIRASHDEPGSYHSEVICEISLKALMDLRSQIDILLAEVGEDE